MEKLIELANAGVSLAIFSGKDFIYGSKWNFTAKKSDDGIALEIKVQGNDLETCIDDLYERWLSATGRGLPHHSLKQIEYVAPPQLDDDIPF